MVKALQTSWLWLFILEMDCSLQEHFYFFLIEERNFTKTHLNITQYMYPLLITSLPICTFLHLKLDIDYKLQALFYTFVTGKVQSHKL